MANSRIVAENPRATQCGKAAGKRSVCRCSRRCTQSENVDERESEGRGRMHARSNPEVPAEQQRDAKAQGPEHDGAYLEQVDMFEMRERESSDVLPAASSQHAKHLAEMRRRSLEAFTRSRYTARDVLEAREDRRSRCIASERRRRDIQQKTVRQNLDEEKEIWDARGLTANNDR